MPKRKRKTTKRKKRKKMPSIPPGECRKWTDKKGKKHNSCKSKKTGAVTFEKMSKTRKA